MIDISGLRGKAEVQASATGGADQRAAPRYPCRLSVEVRGFDHGGLMETVDVSRSGLCIRTETPAPLNELLQLTVYPISSQLGGGIEFSGYVRRVISEPDSGGVPGMAVEIHGCDDVAERRWGALIDALVAQADSAITKPIVIDAAELGGTGPLSLTRSTPGDPFTEQDDSSLPRAAPMEQPIRFPLERVVPKGKIPLTARPRLCLDNEELRTVGKLDQRRAFLLLYIDGNTSVEDIVEMVHFEFSDTIAMLISMVDDGILEW